jgi:methyltransferase family protein/glycosyl transferase family 2
MSKLSVIIPSRDERFLVPTIDDIFRNARGEIEVVAVLDSDKWPDSWAEVVKRHEPRLHTIHQGSPKGMRAAINVGVASAVSRGAEYIAKFDGHCSFGEGFDEILKADCDDDWVVVPRRLRLDPEAWAIAEPDKPPHDYHYLSFPDDPNDFGGAGLNGKPWVERQRERTAIEIDEEMSSQGSGWFMHAAYFERLELMDESNYGPFWNEFQEIGLKCWLSGGRVMVNKRTHYAHLHKGSKYGRGYKLSESWLKQGRNHTMLWPWNEAWAGQTLPFEWLIDHFWPVPTWPENWREVLYATRKPRVIGGTEVRSYLTSDGREVRVVALPEKTDGMGVKADEYHDVTATDGTLRIHSARYGVGGPDDINVRPRIEELITNNSLDLIVNNSTLTPGQNPFRGQKKRLTLVYSYGRNEPVTVTREEKEWLIVGTPRQKELQDFRKRDAELVSKYLEGEASTTKPAIADSDIEKMLVWADGGHVIATASACPKCHSAFFGEVKFCGKCGYGMQGMQLNDPPMSATALNDYLIRKFSISPQRLRAPMPIELRDFHRNDLAQLFAELGFKRGAEIGVAEGNYSEVLLKANPECELLLVDPWHAYSENPQNKPSDKHKFAYEETLRKIAPYRGAITAMKTSMEAVREIAENLPEHLLDFVYIDGNHLFDYVMQDLIEWSKRVRSGGIVSGDDYYQLDQKRWVGGGVVEAVQAYTNAHKIPIWWICNAHRSTDFFWVKP